MKQISVKTSENRCTYPILIGTNILNSLKDILKSKFKKTKKVGLIIDSHVPKKFEQKLKKILIGYEIIIIKKKFNEKNKSFNTIQNFLDILIKKNLSRSDIIICMGGGIAGDISSLVASLLKRGVNFINIPTTLLAQTDSSIGGKTGVNTSQGKNIIGTFYQPKVVIVDTSFLISLSKREIVCGYAEILKHAIIKDKKFFDWLVKNSSKIISLKNNKVMIDAINKSLRIKKDIISKDTMENNLRMILNFGHTFAHAIEAKHKYSGKINHGESVLAGMLLAVKLSVLKGLCGLETERQIFSIYKKNNLRIDIKNIIKRKEIGKMVTLMRNDKKNNDQKINLILLKKIGLTTKPNNFKLSTKELKNIFPKLLNFNL